MSHLSQFMVSVGAVVVSFGAQTVSLACLLRPLWHLGGPSSDSRALGRETMGPRRGFLLILGGFGERIFEVLGLLCRSICVFVSCLFQVTLFNDFGV